MEKWTRMEGTANTGRTKVEAVADLVSHVCRDGRRRYRPEAKQAVLEQCSRPGASIAAVALTNGLNANVVRRWLVEQEGKGAAVKTAADLLPVVIQDLPKQATAAKRAAGETAAIEIDINGARIRVHAGATTEQIAALVSALRA